MKKRLLLIVLVVLLALLAGIVFLRLLAPGTDSASAPTPAPVAAEPTPEPVPESTPEPTPEPTPVPANYPRVTKDPGSETVKANGSCQFVTRFENAKWAEWHFVSPDGTQDLNYLEMKEAYPQLIITGGGSKDITLMNIPASLHGWKVYCRFTNEYGSTDTRTATISIQGQ